LEWFRGEGNGFTGQEVLAAASSLSTVYLAVKTPETGEVWGCVVEIFWKRNDYFNFYQKEVDETMGPISHDCPEQILTLLSPTDNAEALRWRSRCHEKNEARKARPKLVKGLRIHLAHSLHFKDGIEATDLVVENPKRLIFLRVLNPGDPRGEYIGWERYRLRTLEELDSALGLFDEIRARWQAEDEERWGRDRQRITEMVTAGESLISAEG
jgi:hypothetical protein